MTTPQKLASWNLAFSVAILALKSLAWALTGSVALLSDALESTVNIAAALAALVMVRIAARPADDSHPFGHHKAEFFSAVLEGVMIVLAALLILREAWSGLLAPAAIHAPGLGLTLTLLAALANGLWARLLIRKGRSWRSPALVADGRHLMADVVTSVGVAVGLVLAVVTGWWMLDPLVAIAVALNVLWSGYVVIRDSVGGLMDAAAPEETVSAVMDVIAAEAGGAIEAHDLKTRSAGAVTFVEFHLVVPGETTVEAAHVLCDRIEDAIEARVPGARVTIHVEPEHKAKPDEAILPDVGPEAT